FFFQAEDGIRDPLVTGVQTCALPILAEATGVKPLSLVLEEEGRRFGRHTTLIIVTPSADDGWLASLETTVQQGTRAAVVSLEAEIGRASCRERVWVWGAGVEVTAE